MPFPPMDNKTHIHHLLVPKQQPSQRREGCTEHDIRRGEETPETCRAQDMMISIIALSHYQCFIYSAYNLNSLS